MNSRLPYQDRHTPRVEGGLQLSNTLGTVAEFLCLALAAAILTVAMLLPNVGDAQRVVRETPSRWGANRLSSNWKWPTAHGAERLRGDKCGLGSFVSRQTRVFQRDRPPRQSRNRSLH